jgi:hypothetical protein
MAEATVHMHDARLVTTQEAADTEKKTVCIGHTRTGCRGTGACGADPEQEQPDPEVQNLAAEHEPSQKLKHQSSVPPHPGPRRRNDLLVPVFTSSMHRHWLQLQRPRLPLRHRPLPQPEYDRSAAGRKDGSEWQPPALEGSKRQLNRSINPVQPALAGCTQ